MKGGREIRALLGRGGEVGRRGRVPRFSTGGRCGEWRGSAGGGVGVLAGVGGGCSLHSWGNICSSVCVLRAGEMTAAEYCEGQQGACEV